MNREGASVNLVQPWQLFLLQGDHHLMHHEGTLGRALSFQTGDRGFKLGFISVLAMAMLYIARGGL